MVLSSYFLLKPETCFHSDKIEEIILSRDIDITSIHKINNYLDYASMIYEASYGDDNDLYTLIKTKLMLENELYSNNAVILRVSRCMNDLNSFMEYMTTTKDIIRKRLSLCNQRKAYVLVNYANYTKIESNTSPYGSLKIVDESGNVHDLYMLKHSEGEWGVVLFSLVHSPGPSIQEYEREMQLLDSSHHKDIGDKAWAKMKKYKTFSY